LACGGGGLGVARAIPPRGDFVAAEIASRAAISAGVILALLKPSVVAVNTDMPRGFGSLIGDDDLPSAR